MGEQFAGINDLVAFFSILDLGVLHWPTYYSIVLDHDASDEYMGVHGEQTRELIKRHRDAQRFWDVSTDDVLLHGMHGIDIADDAKRIPVVQLLFGVDAATAGFVVDYAQSVIESDPGLGYDHPLFTLNAFAFSAVGEPDGSPFASSPDKIVMGDGIAILLQDLGLGQNAPDFVHAHEMGHHVQYELGLLSEDDGTPEFTRRLELMADAFGAYFAAHSRGLAFQTKRIAQAYAASYMIGDCAFDSLGHHGTPNQRDAAARWGAGVANGGQETRADQCCLAGA
jgi:hypothetical protein